MESHSACLCWQKSYRIAIQTEGMIEDLVKNLSCDNQELQMHCASAIFKVRPYTLNYTFLWHCIKGLRLK